MIDVMDYYGLVVALGRKVHARLGEAGKSVELDDLIQQGFIGLLSAESRYDPDEGTQFATFAYPRIRGAINDYLRSMDLLSQRDRQLVKELVAASETCTQVLGREPTRIELAAEMGVAEEDVDTAGLLGRIGEDPTNFSSDDASYTAPATDPSQEEELRGHKLGEDMQFCLDQVDEVERAVVVFRFWKDLTLQKVSDLVQKPLQTVYNIEKRARRKLMDCLTGKGWDVADVILM